LIYRTGTALSYYEETFKLPLQSFCLPQEARSFLEGLKKLRDQYAP
jgi:hypothetical protein